MANFKLTNMQLIDGEEERFDIYRFTYEAEGRSAVAEFTVDIKTKGAFVAAEKSARLAVKQLATEIGNSIDGQAAVSPGMSADV